jgi:hypothetical protein
MKRFVVIAAMIAAFGLGGAAAFAATADKPPSPPGQGECEHGNDQKACKDDPQTDHGQDCDQHGKQGGVNEDHCAGDSTTTETTTEETTTTETTTTGTTTESTPGETTTSTPTESTATQTSSSETTPETGTTPAETTPSTDENEQSPAQSPGVFSPPAQHSKTGGETTQLVSAGASQAAPKPSKAAQPAPFTP